MANPSMIRALAAAFVAGAPEIALVKARGERALGRPWRWLGSLARQYVAVFAGRTRPTLKQATEFLRDTSTWRRARLTYGSKIKVAEWLTEPQIMLPVPAAAEWRVPVLESVGALAAWLELTPTELEWFADLKGLAYRDSNSLLRHYHYRLRAKPSGVRLIEAPKARLKQMQRSILAAILDRVPHHAASHGFLTGHSIKTFAAPHVGQRVVLRMDLLDFFPSISGARIQAAFRTMGYPHAVAALLGGICSNATPRDVWRDVPFELDAALLHEARNLYARPHLPQGAPSSPALANMCAYRVDCRLAGLAAAAGARYTRYADDLAFSGGADFNRVAEQFSLHVAAILREEGFAANHRKTRIMRQGVRQHLAGLVTNQRLNVARVDFDRLKATLTNCVRYGLESQNREGHPAFRAHLEGRVGFVEMVNPAKGRRLRAIFARIV